LPRAFHPVNIKVIGYAVRMLDSEDTFTQEGGGGGGSSDPAAAAQHGPRAEADPDDDSGPEGEARAAQHSAAVDARAAVVVSLDDVRAVQPPPASPSAYGFEYGSPFAPREVVAGLVCTAWMPALNRQVRAVVADVHVKSLADKVRIKLTFRSVCLARGLRLCGNLLAHTPSLRSVEGLFFFRCGESNLFFFVT
jgi:hypothetical protein